MPKRRISIGSSLVARNRFTFFYIRVSPFESVIQFDVYCGLLNAAQWLIVVSAELSAAVGMPYAASAAQLESLLDVSRTNRRTRVYLSKLMRSATHAKPRSKRCSSAAIHHAATSTEARVIVSLAMGLLLLASSPSSCRARLGHIFNLDLISPHLAVCVAHRPIQARTVRPNRMAAAAYAVMARHTSTTVAM